MSGSFTTTTTDKIRRLARGPSWLRPVILLGVVLILLALWMIVRGRQQSGSHSGSRDSTSATSELAMRITR